MISDIDSFMKKLRGEFGAILSSYCLPASRVHRRAKRRFPSAPSLIFAFSAVFSCLLLDLAGISRKMITIKNQQRSRPYKNRLA